MITDQQVDNFNAAKEELLRQLFELEDWSVDVGNVSFLQKSLATKLQAVQENLDAFNRQIRALGLLGVSVVSDVQPLAKMIREINNIEELDYADDERDKF